MAAHHEIALETARQGIVLLKNDGVLPLATDMTARVAVIGGHDGASAATRVSLSVRRGTAPRTEAGAAV